MLFNILAIISVILMITLLKRLVNIFPSLAACLIRWKENVNLEASVKDSLDRNMIAAVLAIPFCLTAARFRLYDPSFLSGLGENAYTAAIIGIFVLYCGIRIIMSMMVRTKKTGKTIRTAESAAYTFFIILTLVLILCGGIMSFLKTDLSTIRDAMLWVSACIYALFLLRKTQIFISGCSIFTAFLYLCALEIFPTGVLVASALIF